MMHLTDQAEGLSSFNKGGVTYVAEQRVTTSVSMTVQLLRLKPGIRVAQPPLMKNGGKVYLDG
jgi:hypothetical protein